MAKRFLDKVVIVTGSSAGIGRSAALEFAREGASVVIHGQSAERLDATEAQLSQLIGSSKVRDRVLKVRGSLENEEVGERLIGETLRKWGRIDVLVNNAAAACKPGLTFKSFGSHSLENLDYLFAVNLRSIVQLMDLSLVHLAKNKGNVVNVSTTGAVRPLPSAVFYCSLKCALDRVTECYAQVWGPRGVRVNTISPGPTKTLIFERNGIVGERQEEHQKWVKSATVLGRYGRPEEIARALLFLASEQASFVAGAHWLVDGGMAVQTVPIDVGGNSGERVRGG